MTEDVNADVNVNLSMNDTEDKCGLDMSGNAGLPTAAAGGCNGYNNEKGNAEDDPDASYIFVAENDAVAVVGEPADASNLNGKSEPIEKVGSGDVEIDNNDARPVLDHGDGDVGGEKEETNGAFQIPNGCQGVVEENQDGVDLSTIVGRSEEFQVNVLEIDSEDKLLQVSVSDEKAEEDDIVGSALTEESQVANNPSVAESDESMSSEAVVISSVYVAGSEENQSGIAEIISSNNIAESERSQSGEAEVLSCNYVADTEQNQSGKAEDLSTMDVAESELSRSGNTEDMVEVGSKLDLLSSIEENQDSSATITVGVEDDTDVDLNHGRESVGSTTNVSEGPQGASQMDSSVKLDKAEFFYVSLSDDQVNGLSAGCAKDGLAETSVVNGIAGAPQITVMEDGGSEELGRSENLTSSDAEVGMSFPAASDVDSIRDSKNEFTVPVIQLESATNNGHVTYQNGETNPTDTVLEVDNGLSCLSDTALEVENDNSCPSGTAPEPVVENGHSCPSDTASEPVVDNGYSHPVHDSEINEPKTEAVDEKLNAYGSDSVGPHSVCGREVLVDPDNHPLVMKTIPSPQGNDSIPETEGDIVAIKSDEVPALSSDVVNIKSEVSAKAANNFGEFPDSAEDPEREACAHDSVENAVDVKVESVVANSFMLPREVPHEDGPASESELVENPVDVKAESEDEDSLAVLGEVPHDDVPASESVSVENPIDAAAESEMVLGELPHGDVPASESKVLDDSVHSSGGIENCIRNDLQVENKGNQLCCVEGDEKTSKENVDANAEQGEASSSSAEGIDGQNLVVEEGKRPFYYMIRIPRYDNGENLREQIKHAQNQVDEKTKSRDVIRAEMQKQRVCCNEFGACLDDAISEETAARDLLKAKRREIDSVLLVINKVRSARDVEEIDAKIRNMEHMLQHETLALKEEKSYIRSIQQLKQTREQLSFSLGKQEDVREVLNQKEEVEERLKVLRKEADQLRENVFKEEGAAKIANKIYQDEKIKLNELTMQFRAADDVRQKAYADLQSLRKQSYDKNKYFWKYKDDAKAAYDLASKREKDELQSHCINQVERVMELWNSNDEFRKEYVRCNIRSTLRRLRTLDGRSLGLDEEPPVIPNVTERTVKETIVPSISTLDKENTVAPVKTEKDYKSVEKSGDQIKPTAESKKPARPAPLGNGVAPVSAVSQRNEIEEATQQEENKPTKEEAELIRKAEELRKEQEAEILREQRRMEEKAKAKEAMERKKRNADKAQARAALRAQKEAEQKEKEREKRARKKEKRKAVEEVNVVKEGEESAPSSETPPETKVSETGEKPITQTKRSEKPSQFTKQTKSKSIPPLPLRNRGKRRMQTWMWALVAVLAVLFLFLVGNGGFGFGFGFSLQRFGF